MRCDKCFKPIKDHEKLAEGCEFCHQWTWVDIKNLKENENNPRKITRNELNKLVRNIKTFGFVEPIIVNTNADRHNVIIGGHQRIKAIKAMKWKQIAVSYVNLPKEQEEILNVSLNAISGEWDEDKLTKLLNELNEAGNVDLTLTGFDEPYLDEMLGVNVGENETEIEETPAIPEKPKSKKGEIYLLGKHRLLCGDSTKEEDFKALMRNKKADMCWTDPPYGVSYKGTNNPDGRDWGVMDNDGLRKEELFQFLSALYKNVAKYTKDIPAIYTCYASINHTIFERALNDAGLTIKQQLIWEKGHVLGHSDYHWCHEPILYCRKKENNAWYGDRTHKTVILNSTIEQLNQMKKEELIELISQIRQSSDLIKIQKDSHTSYLHPTQKPVALSLMMIKNSCRPTESVLEPCGGSGSVLMACETSGRTCYCLELSPAYVDVIINRWAKFTGKDPIREKDKKKWSEIK